MVAFCLFGAGEIGAVQAANIAAHPKACLRTVVDVVPRAGRALAERHGAAFSDDGLSHARAYRLCAALGHHGSGAY